MSVGNVIAAGTGMYINIQIRGGGIVPPFTPLNQNIFYGNRPLIARMDVSILISVIQAVLFIINKFCLVHPVARIGGFRIHNTRPIL